MKKKIILAAISCCYTLLYRVALDHELLLVHMPVYRNYVSTNGALILLLFLMLHYGVIVLVSCLFDKIEDYFSWIYVPSLLTSFLMPLLFAPFRELHMGMGTITLSWAVIGGCRLVLNLFFGPSMVFLICYMRKISR